jgi:hypothetical protein
MGLAFATSLPGVLIRGNRVRFGNDDTLSRLLKSYCGGHLPRCPVLEILTYAQVRSGFCAPCALQLAILATLFNSLLEPALKQRALTIGRMRA